MEARFNLTDANRLLPLLQLIGSEVEERRADRQRLTKIRDELESARTPEGLQSSLAELDARIYEHRLGIDAAVNELESLGMTILRLNPVTIHIPGDTQRGPIVFCWQLGENRIGHGHMVGEEEDPRRPLKVRITSS